MYKILLSLAFSIFCFGKGVAQSIDSLLASYNSGSATEKIYIHYDKEYYVAGETIWFKAYLYSEGKPSSISNNFYLQFIDSKGEVIFNQKYPVVGAVVKGNINLPDSLLQGNYYIRAITPYLLNFDNAFAYAKNIFVFKPGTLPATNNVAANLSLQFFPESGALLDGILTVVGFKATDQYGAPVDVEGIIKTDDGTTIASFKSYHEGMGKVQFKPQLAKKYIAEVETAAGKRIYNLPAVEAAGLSLKIQEEKGGKKFQLFRTAKNKTDYDELIVVAQINNQVVYEMEIDFEDYPSIIGHLVTDSLPSGILHFTVFNKDRMPLAERLCFIDNGEYRAGGNIETIKADFSKRGANELQIIFPQGIQRSLSVSVADYNNNGFNDKENIWSRLLLTSDLKGHIYNAGWYFQDQNDSTRIALDNLMLTQGWSRYSWTKVMQKELPVMKYNDIPLINISGKIIDPRTKNPLAWGKAGIVLEAGDSTSQTWEALIDANGKFMLDSLAFFGPSKLYYAYSDKNEKQLPATIILDENGMEKDIQVVNTNLAIAAGNKNPLAINYTDEVAIRQQQIKATEQIKELQNITVTAVSNKKPVDIVNEKYTGGVFKGPAKEVLDNINDPVTDKSLNAVDYIKNRIQQVEYIGNGFVNRKNFSLMSGQKWAVGIFLNEQPADAFLLRTLRANEIALVKFFDAGFVGVGSTFPGGAISVYTKEKFAEERKPEKFEFVTYNGYTIRKEFYHPDYSFATNKQPGIDNRSTLYWNPDVFTDAETKTFKLPFFNNDFSKKYKIVVEGFDAAGKLLHIEKIIDGN